MRRVLPFLLFAAVTLAVFWKFLFFGHTLHAVVLLEHQLGLEIQEPSGWFRPDRPRAHVADNLILLANHLRIYNEGLKSGEFRLWNPSLCCGLPIYADPMVHPFYPPQFVLHALLPPDPAYEIFLLLHLFFSGVALYALLRGLGRSAPAATAGGVLWMLLGYNSMWFSTGILAGVSVWGPLALLGIHRACSGGRLTPAAAGGMAMGLAILGSHPQHALHVFLFTLGWLAVSLFRARPPGFFVRRASALYVLLSVGCGLAGILTRLDTIANGYRNPDADFRFFYGDGGALARHALDAVVGKMVSFDNQLFDFEFTFHAGLAAVGLAAIAVIRGFRDARIRYLALVAGGTLVVAFVRPAALLLQQIPLLQLSLPSRWLFVFGMALTLLAAEGWDSLRDRAGRSTALGAALAGLAGAALLLAARTPSAVDTAIGFALVAAAALARRSSARLSGSLALVAILFELLPSFLIANWHVDPGPMQRVPPVVTAAASGTEPWRGTGALGSPQSTAWRSEHPNETPAAYPMIQDLTDGNNLLALFGVENPAGFEAIMPGSYVNYVLAAGGEIAPGGRSTVFLSFRTRLVDAMNLRYAFLPPGLPTPPRFRPIPGDFGSIRLYENPAALPRAWLVGSAIAARSEKEAVEKTRAPGFDPRTTVVLETEETLPPGGAVDGGVRFTHRSSDRLELHGSTRQPAILVLSENDYPGWEATVDGAPVPILRANIAFRAVALPAGDHTVSFVFRPEAARHGAAGSALFLLAGGIFTLVRRRVEGAPC